MTPRNRQLAAITITLILAGAALALIARTSGPAATWRKEPVAQGTPAAPQETRIFLAGDVMLSREVKIRMDAANDQSLPYAKVVERIRAADIAFANLESPFSPTNLAPTNRLVFQAEPRAVDGLTAAGFDILSTANNHAFDQGRAGVEYTLDWPTRHGIRPVGTGTDCRQGQVMEADGMRIGFLAYSYAAYNDGGASKDPLSCDWLDQAGMQTDIKALKPQVDYLIVSAHMGQEYQRKPEQANVTRARAAIDAGADLVVGHHPHWHQVVEEYNGRHILYSLGNFVFDQMWSQETREGLAAELLFKDKKPYTITLLPVVIDDFCCPRWADEQETKTILGRIDLTSPVLPVKN